MTKIGTTRESFASNIEGKVPFTLKELADRLTELSDHKDFTKFCLLALQQVSSRGNMGPGPFWIIGMAPD